MNQPDPAIEHKRQQAAAAMEANDPATAVRLLQEVCEEDPGEREAWLTLAEIHGQQGDFREVIECCNRLLAVAPRNSRAFAHLGGAHAALGHPREAVAAYRRAVALAPDDPAIRIQFGNVLCMAGKLEQGVAEFQAAIRLRPGDANPHYRLANALLMVGRYDEAILQYKAAVSCDPQLVEAHFNLGKLLAQVGKLDESEAALRRGLALHPEAVELWEGLSNTLRFQGRYDEAWQPLQRAARIRPDDAALLGNEADLCEHKGELGEAYRRIRTLVERGSVDAIAADVYLRLCRRYGSCDEAIELAEGLLASGSLNDGSRQMLQFRLGDVCDKLSRFDDAFTHYAAANRSVNVTYDPAAQEGRIDGLIAAYCDEAMAKMASASNRSERPVLIVGMPRSGTSLVEQILASHPQVFGAGELEALNDMVYGLPKTLYPQCMEAAGPEVVEGLAQRYLQLLDSLDGEAARVTDKMPANFMHLGVVSRMLPGAHIIHCVREPLDTCLSIYFQNFNLAHKYATDLTAIGHYYRQYQRLMDHWRSVVDLPMLEVSYAEVVADQEGMSRKMVEFVGLPWDDRCLDFHKSDRKVSTASYDQVRQPLYTSSLARWRNYEKYLGPLREAWR